MFRNILSSKSSLASAVVLMLSLSTLSVTNGQGDAARLNVYVLGEERPMGINVGEARWSDSYHVVLVEL